jgi:hypothetical protein
VDSGDPLEVVVVEEADLVVDALVVEEEATKAAIIRIQAGIPQRPLPCVYANIMY